MAQRVTIYAIARELQVHPSTVSRAFNQPNLVRDDVRKRILRRAAELDYRPNRVARSLVTGRTQMMGLLIPDVENPFFPPLIRAVQKAATRHGYGILLLDSELKPSLETDLLSRVRTQVDGMLISSPMSPIRQLARALRGSPAVVLNRENDTFPSVVIDHTKALCDAGDLLVGLGHRRIALLRGPARSWAARRRAEAVRRWARTAGMDLVELGPFQASHEGGMVAAESLAGTGVSAAFAFDDLMATGVVAGMAERGILIPDSFSLIGCDDVLLSRVSTPALTTLSAALDDLAETGLGLLADSIADTSPSRIASHVQGHKSTRLPSALVVRSSTAPPGELPAYLADPAHA